MMVPVTTAIIMIVSLHWRYISGFSVRQHPPPSRRVVYQAKSRQSEQQIHVDEITREKQTNKWIVVVEDEDFLRNAIGKYLSKEGNYFVTGVADARSAFLLCRGIFKPINNRYNSFKFDPTYNATDVSFKRPDCVLLDVSLDGEIDGIKLLNIIRSDALIESLPVILLTAKGKIDDRIAGYEAGADAYLTKPFDPEELLSVVEGVLRRDSVSPLVSDDSNINEREKSSPTNNLILPMEEIQSEIQEIKSLLRKRNNIPEGMMSKSNSTSTPDESNAKPSFASLYKELIEVKEEIQSTSSNMLQPIDEDDDAQIVTPKVTVDDVNGVLFTPDELRVIRLVLAGLTNKEIGEEHMGCSTSKVEKIVSSLFKKTGTKKRPKLVAWWKQNQGVLSVRGEQEPDPKPSKKMKLLTRKQEKEIMNLIGKGFTNKEIATNIGVSLKEVVAVVDNKLVETKLNNRTDLMKWWNSKKTKLS